MQGEVGIELARRRSGARIHKSREGGNLCLYTL